MQAKIYLTVSQLTKLSKLYDDDFLVEIDRDDFVAMMKANTIRWAVIVEKAVYNHDRQKFFKFLRWTTAKIQERDFAGARYYLKQARNHRTIFRMPKFPR